MIRKIQSIFTIKTIATITFALLSSFANLSPVFADANSSIGPILPASDNLRIEAINPGYTISGQANSGEFIELHNLSGTSLSLTDITISYTNSSGNTTLLLEFPTGSEMTGERILLRLASSPEADQADLLYTRTLAFGAGPLELKFGDTIISSLCWTGKDDCYAKFKRDNPTSLVYNPSTNSYEHKTDYTPTYDETGSSYYVPAPTPDEPTPSKCRGLEFSEIFTYYETSASEQFVELHNFSDSQIDLTGCQLKYKNKFHPLSGVIQPDGYFARYAADLVFTKNPTSSNSVQLIDTDGAVLDTLTYYNGQKQSASYAHFGYLSIGEKEWLQTYAPTPGEPNNYQQFKTCPTGKVLNETTGNCVKSTTTDTELQPCPEGKYRNPLTGRCKSYASSTTSTLKDCAEGYERNPDTNRCRKIKTNTGADYPLATTETSDETVFIAVISVAIVAGVALLYVIFQFRQEITTLFHRVHLRFSSKASSCSSRIYEHPCSDSEKSPPSQT